jgi:hypothetical protein
MEDRERQRRRRDDATSSKKQNNPFSEQEKHGDEAQRRGPRTEQEAQGGSVQTPVLTEDK